MDYVEIKKVTVGEGIFYYLCGAGACATLWKGFNSLRQAREFAKVDTSHVIPG